MKNKQKLWRNMAVKGKGKMLRNALHGINHPATSTPFIESLVNRSVDKTLFEKYNILTPKESLVVQEEAITVKESLTVQEEAITNIDSEVTDVEII